MNCRDKASAWQICVCQPGSPCADTGQALGTGAGPLWSGRGRVSAADQRSKAKDRKQMCGGLGLGTGWGVAANGSGASFCSEGNVLESQWWWLPSCECSTDR